jgi:hypothetical protein
MERDVDTGDLASGIATADRGAPRAGQQDAQTERRHRADHDP